MDSIPVPYTVQLMVREHVKGALIYDYKYQRKPGQWNKRQKDKLINSVMRGLPFNPIYLAKSGSRGIVIDGIQRLTTIITFINNEWALSKDAEDVSLVSFDEKGRIVYNTFSVAKKRFKDLDSELKEAILNCKVNVEQISNYDDEELKEMFIRLNSASSMNNAQKSVVNMNDILYDMVKDNLNRYDDFWENLVGLTDNELRKDINRQLLMQTLSVCYYYPDIKGYKNQNLNIFLRDVQEGKDEEVKKRLIDLFNKMIDVIEVFLSSDILEKFDSPMPNLNKTSVPVIFYAAMGLNGDVDKLKKYAVKVNEFFVNDYQLSEYSDMCKGGGLADSTKVRERASFFVNMVKSICDNDDK